ncbi:uncharacterized protein LOC129763368 [Toxorhynchites rutilus septentrionalis]|uniref:uncharacterized protein LOC129763368 n=1 Tax=Toxorhynchites rutilus septentrionalis TaxID=329112 RepID=UPI00247A03B2|nr:uncharacterized protein LOC129763368 [Toxorhynchites rutilus septentrionalis]
MKAILMLFVLVVAVSARCIRDNSDGQPGCKKQEELNQKFWRHNHDPTAYWECVKLNEPGVARRCVTEMAFHATLLECVDWDEWEWEPTCVPLSRPDN